LPDPVNCFSLEQFAFACSEGRRASKGKTTTFLALRPSEEVPADNNPQ
jgi:hypothetical protein